ncbi:unnamed protein product [Scytosiphon promiscuus]
MSSASAPRETAAQQDVLTFARLCPFNDSENGSDDGRGRLEYEVLRDADDDDEDEPDEVGHTTALFSFTGVLRDDATQEEVFQTAAIDVVDSCLHGVSGAVLAYGQTNSGKTWTVTGGEGFEERGLAPRAIGHLFREIRSAEASETPVRYEVRASYLEVYEDRVYDLLDVSNRDKPMEEWATVTPLADGEGHQVLKGLTTFDVDNEVEDTLNLFFMGNSHRIMGETPANCASSRSHAVFTLTISSARDEQTIRRDADRHPGDRSDSDGLDDGDSDSRGERNEARVVLSQCELTLVDLAGCERMYKNDGEGYSAGLDDAPAMDLNSGSGSDASAVLAAHEARKAAREREGKKINSALHNLEKVMLTLQNPGGHIPYRESTLTWVLRNCLGGGGVCRTVFIVALSLDVEDLPETVSSCRFAQSCRKALVCPSVADPDERLEPDEELRFLRREANDMKAALLVKDDLLREVAEEMQQKNGDLEEAMEKLEALEASRAFHETRSPTEEDKGECAALAQALSDGSDEAGNTLEVGGELDRVSALQCCRELRGIMMAEMKQLREQVRSLEDARSDDPSAPLDDGDALTNTTSRPQPRANGEADRDGEAGSDGDGQDQSIENPPSSTGNRGGEREGRGGRESTLPPPLHVVDEAEGRLRRAAGEDSRSSYGSVEGLDEVADVDSDSEGGGGDRNISDFEEERGGRSSKSEMAEAGVGAGYRKEHLGVRQTPGNTSVFEGSSPDLNGSSSVSSSRGRSQENCSSAGSNRSIDQSRDSSQSNPEKVPHQRVEETFSASEDNIDNSNSSARFVDQPEDDARTSSSARGAQGREGGLTHLNVYPGGVGARVSSRGHPAADDRLVHEDLTAAGANVSADSAKEAQRKGGGQKDRAEQGLETPTAYRSRTSTAANTRATTGGNAKRGHPRHSRANLSRALGTRDITGEEANTASMAHADRPKHRRNLAKGLGTRDFGTRDFGDRGSSRYLEVGGRPPPLAMIVDSDDEVERAPDGMPLRDRGVGRNDRGSGVGGDIALPIEIGVNAAYDDERQRALLNGGGFFVMHGRFGNRQMRFVWMSRDLGTILWRCCGHTAVKGSAKTTLFDFVHLGLHKSKLATTEAAGIDSHPGASAAAAAAGSAMKQIVLTGGGGRNRLVLELDGGNSEMGAEVVQTWFEAFNYAVNFANTEVIARMLNPTGRRSSLTQSAAVRRSSLSNTPPVPPAHRTAPPVAGRRGTQTATNNNTQTAGILSQSMRPAERGKDSSESPPLEAVAQAAIVSAAASAVPAKAAAVARAANVEAAWFGRKGCGLIGRRRSTRAASSGLSARPARRLGAKTRGLERRHRAGDVTPAASMSERRGRSS